MRVRHSATVCNNQLFRLVFSIVILFTESMTSILGIRPLVNGLKWLGRMRVPAGLDLKDRGAVVVRREAPAKQRVHGAHVDLGSCIVGRSFHAISSHDMQQGVQFLLFPASPFSIAWETQK